MNIGIKEFERGGTLKKWHIFQKVAREFFFSYTLEKKGHLQDEVSFCEPILNFPLLALSLSREALN